MTVSVALLAATLLFGGGAGTAADGLVARDAIDIGAPDGGGPDGGRIDGGGPDGGAREVKSPALAVAVPVGRLAGRVLAQGGRMTVPGASLIAGTTEVGATDDRGYFSVDLPCGPTTLSILAAGFERLTTTIDVCADLPAPLTFRLLPAQGVSGQKTIVRAISPQPSVRISGEELVKTPGTLGDPLRVIESLPGVTGGLGPTARPEPGPRLPHRKLHGRRARAPQHRPSLLPVRHRRRSVSAAADLLPTGPARRSPRRLQQVHPGPLRRARERDVQQAGLQRQRDLPRPAGATQLRHRAPLDRGARGVLTRPH